MLTSIKRASILVICLGLFALTGCSSLKPWVLSHERSILADPIMAFDRGPASARYMHHVYESRESERGAEGSAGGGCGCN